MQKPEGEVWQDCLADLMALWCWKGAALLTSSHAFPCWQGLLLSWFSLLTLQKSRLCVCVCVCVWRRIRLWITQQRMGLNGRTTVMSCQISELVSEPHGPTLPWQSNSTPFFTQALVCIWPGDESLQHAKLVEKGWVLGCRGCVSSLHPQMAQSRVR